LHELSSKIIVENVQYFFKGQVRCFSMQVVMKKCFLLNSEKKFGADSSCRFRGKRTLLPKNVVTEPKARLL